MKELLNQWKTFCHLNGTSRQKLKAAVLKWFGRIGMAVLPMLKTVTIGMAKCLRVEAYWQHSHQQSKGAAKKKQISETTISQLKEKFPKIETAKCKCTRHKAGCGCLSDGSLSEQFRL